MKLHIQPILTFLSVVIVVSHASLPPELYWKEVLPYTNMPKAIRTSLPKPEYMEGKGAVVNVGKGGVHVNTGHGGGGTTVNVGPHSGVGVTTGKGHTNVNVGPKSGVGVTTGKPTGAHTSVGLGKGGVAVSTGKPTGAHTSVGVGKGGVGVFTGKPTGAHTSVGVGKGGVGVHTNKPGKGGAQVGVGKGGVVVRTGPKKKPVYVGVKPGPDPFVYNYAATETQLNDKGTRAVFMQEKDLRPGYQTNLHFTQSTNGATFLPRQVANSIPFSSNDMSKILQEFSIDPNSDEAKIVEQTVDNCESKSIKGEEKYCATSLESMVDHVTSTLGKNVKVVSTETNEKSDKVEKYVISGVRKIANEGEAEVCHKQNYAYAVFYCHKNKHTTAYMVSLMSEDGSKAKAVAVCHKDTSGWNPQHLAFKVLEVKPGSVPICHFLPEDHIIWVRN